MVKQVIILRKDLNMRKGKMVAQGSHSSLKVFFDRMEKVSSDSYAFRATDAMQEWIDGSFTKICLSVDSEAELVEIYEKAKEAGIPCALITDEGHTEFKGVPTKTAVALGPDNSEKIDPFTSHLKLL